MIRHHRVRAFASARSSRESWWRRTTKREPDILAAVSKSHLAHITALRFRVRKSVYLKSISAFCQALAALNVFRALLALQKLCQ